MSPFSQSIGLAQQWNVNNEASFREALESAQAGDTIVLQNNIILSSIEGLALISEDVIIDANNKNITYPALGSDGIDNVHITGGFASSGKGGAINVGGNLTGDISNSYFANNTAALLLATLLPMPVVV